MSFAVCAVISGCFWDAPAPGLVLVINDDLGFRGHLIKWSGLVVNKDGPSVTGA